MLAICEECSKKYNIDASKMRGERARFSCQECGHIIVVVKVNNNQPDPDTTASSPMSSSSDSV